MARSLIRHFDVTIPAGTPRANPLVSTTRFDPAIVERIEWLFPAGCAGQVGIQIGARGVQIVPFNSSQFLVRTGDSSGAEVEGLHKTGDWSVIGYNTGAFDHTVHVTFHARPVTDPDEQRFTLDYTDPILGIGAS